jgi:hypothetical protein
MTENQLKSKLEAITGNDKDQGIYRGGFKNSIIAGMSPTQVVIRKFTKGYGIELLIKLDKGHPLQLLSNIDQVIQWTKDYNNYK